MSAGFSIHRLCLGNLGLRFLVTRDELKLKSVCPKPIGNCHIIAGQWPNQLQPGHFPSLQPHIAKGWGGWWHHWLNLARFVNGMVQIWLCGYIGSVKSTVSLTLYYVVLQGILSCDSFPQVQADMCSSPTLAHPYLWWVYKRNQRKPACGLCDLVLAEGAPYVIRRSRYKSRSPATCNLE